MSKTHVSKSWKGTQIEFGWGVRDAFNISVARCLLGQAGKLPLNLSSMNHPASMQTFRGLLQIL